MATTKKTASTRAAKKAVKKTPTKRAAKSSTRDPLVRVRDICLSLPETTEVLAWGEPTFRVKGKIFAMYAGAGNHHGAGRPGIWMLSVSLEQDLVMRARPDRYYKPPYVGPSGWIGAYLDGNPPWMEIEELLRDAWRRRAPKKLVERLSD